MNVVFLSPHFPPTYYLFCVHLRAVGATVLGIGDVAYEALRPELRSALSEYYRVDDMHNYDELVRALGYFTHRHGKLDRLDSQNEYWLETEARLRTDFNIPGLKESDLPAIKRKSVMKRMFDKAGVPTARGTLARTPAQVRRFAREVGLPLVAKPDVGVGASRTYKLQTDADVESFVTQLPPGYVLEEFVQGTIQTFDGLADRDGEPVFFTSMEYSQGVMEIVNSDTDIYYYTLREIPADLERAGRALLRAYEVRERMFHFEFFRTPAGALVGLEVNMRPPGGPSLDMFNFASDIDLYYQWATMVTHGRYSAHRLRPYHVCYAGRKPAREYQLSHQEVLERYAGLLIDHRTMPEVFQRAMGAYFYLLRSPRLDELVEAARAIQTLHA